MAKISLKTVSVLLTVATSVVNSQTTEGLESSGSASSHGTNKTGDCFPLPFSPCQGLGYTHYYRHYSFSEQEVTEYFYRISNRSLSSGCTDDPSLFCALSFIPCDPNDTSREYIPLCEETCRAIAHQCHEEMLPTVGFLYCWSGAREQPCFQSPFPLPPINTTTVVTQLRLVNGSHEWEGRLEININGTWGTVCDDWFDSPSAWVACAMLGYRGSWAVVETQAHYGRGSGPILLQSVDCKGYETNILDCGQKGELKICYHSEDVGLNCQPSDEISAMLRLENGLWPWEGRVAMQFPSRGLWHYFCLDNFGVNEARAVCRTLGYNSANAVVQLPEYYGQSQGPWLSMKSTCTGNETNAPECLAAGGPSDECGRYSYDAGVACPPDNWTLEIQIHLADGPSPAEGRVELKFQGVWGTVCGDYFEEEEAAVVCRMLGLSTDRVAVRKSAYYRQGPGPILLDDVDCTGEEANIMDCKHRRLGLHNCRHNEDVGVDCDAE